MVHILFIRLIYMNLEELMTRGNWVQQSRNVHRMLTLFTMNY